MCEEKGGRQMCYFGIWRFHPVYKYLSNTRVARGGNESDSEDGTNLIPFLLVFHLRWNFSRIYFDSRAPTSSDFVFAVLASQCRAMH